MILSIIDNWQPWYSQHLQQAFPRFPAKTLLSFNDQSALRMPPQINASSGMTMIFTNTLEELVTQSQNSRALPSILVLIMQRCQKKKVWHVGPCQRMLKPIASLPVRKNVAWSKLNYLVEGGDSLLTF
jgi:hypothetical protein